MEEEDLFKEKEKEEDEGIEENIINNNVVVDNKNLLTEEEDLGVNDKLIEENIKENIVDESKIIKDDNGEIKSDENIIDLNSLKEKDEIENDENNNILKAKDEDIEKLKSYLDSVNKLIQNNPRIINRVENKHDFASEVVNVQSNQKIANLSDDEINDLLAKRRFMNFCNEYQWEIVGKLAMNTIRDIENYSLSKEGFLIDRAMIESSKQLSEQINKNIENKK